MLVFSSLIWCNIADDIKDNRGWNQTDFVVILPQDLEEAKHLTNTSWILLPGKNFIRRNMEYNSRYALPVARVHKLIPSSSSIKFFFVFFFGGGVLECCRKSPKAIIYIYIAHTLFIFGRCRHSLVAATHWIWVWVNRTVHPRWYPSSCVYIYLLNTYPPASCDAKGFTEFFFIIVASASNYIGQIWCLILYGRQISVSIQ